ncbi:MAG: hypothetical protein ABIS67_12650 [Candidatus Eisenbacteria bacterium]
MSLIHRVASVAILAALVFVSDSRRGLADSVPRAPISPGWDDLAISRRDAPAPRTPRGFQGLWHEAEHSPRSNTCLVFDSRRRRLIELSSGSGLTQMAVWACNTEGEPRWHPLLAIGEGPKCRVDAAAVYDSLYDRVLLYGGSPLTPLNGLLPSEGDLWELRLGGLPRWKKIEAAPGNAPSPRFACGVAFDARRQRMVLVSGVQLDFYDFLGGAHYIHYDEVWTLSLDLVPRWEKVESIGTAPEAAMDFAAAYDSDRDEVIVMGGGRRGGFYIPSIAYREVWTFSLSSGEWRDRGPQELSATSFPSIALIYDTIRHRAVAFSGSDSSTRAFVAGVGAPSVPLGGRGPFKRYGPRMVWDAAGGAIWLTGGSTDPDVWRLVPAESEAWQHFETGPAELPTATLSTFTPDPLRDRILLSGGHIDVTIAGRTMKKVMDEVWAFSTRDEMWTRLSVPIPHGGLVDHRAVRDPVRDRLILIGGSAPGESPGALIPNTKMFSLPLAGGAWQEIETGGFPPEASELPSLVLDEAGDRLILQGSNLAHEDSRQVWVLPLAGEPRFVSLSPAGDVETTSREHSSIYDPVRRRMILAGSPDFTCDCNPRPLWALDLADPMSWSEIHPQAPPLPLRRRQFAAYDPHGDRMLTYGGSFSYDERVFRASSAVWTLSLSNPVVWDSLEVQGVLPEPRAAGSVAFDANSRKLVAAGSALPYGRRLVTCVLDFHPPTRQVDVLVMRGPSNPRSRGEVAVAILSEPHFDARRLNPADLLLDGAPVGREGPRWKTRAVDANGDGLLDLECCFARHEGDRGAAGTALTLSGYDAEDYPLRGEDDLRVAPGRDREAQDDLGRAAAVAFALHGAHPNPSLDGRLQVRFTLPVAARATLDLFDVAGRTVERHQPPMIAGPGFVRLGECAPLAPGLYWIRLRQNDRVATTRAVVLR